MIDKTELNYQRMLPALKAHCNEKDPSAWKTLQPRIKKHFPEIFNHLFRLYQHHYDFYYHHEAMLKSAIDAYIARPDDLRKLDLKRLKNPVWYKDESMIGAVAYADLFAGGIKGIGKRLPYLEKLEVNYLHLMPFFDCPEGMNDGGYAVSDYRKVMKGLGTIKDLSALASELRKRGISLVADFVFNHTSDEHVWAKKAKAGDPFYQGYYYMYPDRTIPDMFDKSLREIFPDTRRGSFSWVPDAGMWVWTTFHNYQWDLNYANPEVLKSIAGEMFFLANAGVEVLRLDAIAFTWKRPGTTSENQPEAHILVKTLNALLRIAAPAVEFKSEAIVHPDFVNRYIAKDQCALSYNPLMMALMWEALATRDASLLHRSLKYRFGIPKDTVWVNYVRCHDDIGWTFSDEDAASIGINGYDHRRFLNDFYVGRFPGSFSVGEPFQFNPDTGDMRICGMAASLTGLEKGLLNADENECRLAIKRMTLLYALAMFAGGIPLIYLGDELALTNDYSYKSDPNKRHDSRWVHRIAVTDDTLEIAKDNESWSGMMFANVRKMVRIRKSNALFGDAATRFIHTGNKHLFAFEREKNGKKLLVIANFSEHLLHVNPSLIANSFENGALFDELWGGKKTTPDNLPELDAYGLMLLVPA